MKILNKKNILLRLSIISAFIFLSVTGCQQPAEEEVEGISQGDASWHEVGTAGEPGLLNGWTNAGGFETCGFRKDGFGIVHLKGRLNGTAATIIFYLPEGYRPDNLLDIGDPTAFIAIGTNGAVSSFLTPAFLDGISFYAN